MNGLTPFTSAVMDINNIQNTFCSIPSPSQPIGNTASASSSRPDNVPLNQQQFSQYWQKTREKTQNVQEAAKALNLKVTMPFSQDAFQEIIYQLYPNAVQTIPAEERQKGICLGLSVIWLKHRMAGRSNQDFHRALFNPGKDPSLKQVLDTQYIEQSKVPSNAPIHNISEQVALSVGLNPIPTSSQQISRIAPIAPIRDFIVNAQALLNDHHKQGFLLLTESHAMALFRDVHCGLHFYDPNNGVICADPAHDIYLFAMMSDIMESSYAQSDNSVYMTEVQTSQRVEPSPISLGGFHLP